MKFYSLVFLLFILPSCNSDDSGIAEKRKSLVDSYEKYLQSLPNETLLDSNFAMNDLFLIPMAAEFPDKVFPQYRRDSVVNAYVRYMTNDRKAKKTNEYSVSVLADFGEISGCVEMLKNEENASFDDVNLIDFLMYFTVVDSALAYSLAADLKIYDPKLHKALKAKYNGNVADSVYLGKKSILAHMSYNGKPIKTDSAHYMLKGVRTPISTIFDVGRLCPPKCIK